MVDHYETSVHRHHGALITVSVVLALFCGSLLAAAARPAQAKPVDAPSLSATPTSHPKTRVYYPSGKAVGFIVRYSKSFWEGDSGAFISIRLTKKGAFMIYENETWLNYAYASPRGQQHRYVARSGEVFGWASTTRWNVYRRGRLVAFTRGPDGVPASLAFVTDALKN